MVMWLSAALLVGGCSSAYADRIAPEPGGAYKPIPDRPAASPYQVDLIGENGSALNTYLNNGRYYVLGQVGERYTIRVQNPTDRRVEAVISVDGLDAIDGKTADYATKRGYIVPAYGELRVEGFRVSTSEVATFRFSSVAASYAGRKGQARNVGVIGVAIFDERPQPEIVVPVVEHRPPPPRDIYWGDLEESGADDYGRAGGEAKREANYDSTTADAPAKPAPPPAETAPTGGAGSTGAPATRDRYVEQERRADPDCCGARPKSRPGLGTEFGENRYSAVSFTRFERANPNRPIALAELRYNDRDGLLALGIPLAPRVDPDEISTRETADPFPGTGYAEPPIGWR
jgi:hypothetical protein